MSDGRKDGPWARQAVYLEQIRQIAIVTLQPRPLLLQVLAQLQPATPPAYLHLRRAVRVRPHPHFRKWCAGFERSGVSRRRVHAKHGSHRASVIGRRLAPRVSLEGGYKRADARLEGGHGMRRIRRKSGKRRRRLPAGEGGRGGGMPVRHVSRPLNFVVLLLLDSGINI